MAAKRIAFVLGLGAGYVLGAKAGRQRYQQIISKAQDVWHNPTVQAKADDAQHLAMEKATQAGAAVAGSVKGKAGSVGSTIADKVSRRSEDDQPAGAGLSTDSQPGSSAGGSHSRSSTPSPEEVSLGGTGSGVDAPTSPVTPPPVPGSGAADSGVNSPSDKLPPHPVAKPGVPGASPE